MVASLFKYLSIIAILTLVFTGCGSSPKPEEDFRCKQDGILAPKWTCNPFVEGSISAIGIAKRNAGNDKSMQRAEAMADGRDALASQIATKVSNLFKSYKATTGTGTSATFDASTSKVSKQLANQTLEGTRATASWTHPKTGELYLLIAIGTGGVKDSMDQAIKTSFKNEQAMYQKFLAEKEQGNLDKELEKAGLQ